MPKSFPLPILLALTGIPVLMHLSAAFVPGSLPDTLLFASRWIAVASMMGCAALRRNLTVWILTSMALGVVLGYDFPQIATPDVS